MTFSYDLNQLATSPRYRLRLELGDTNSGSVLLQDEEIDFYLTQEGGFYRAAYAATQAIARQFAREAGFTVGQLKVDLASRARTYQTMADAFLKKAAEEAIPSGPVATALSDCPPDIYRGMHDYPWGAFANDNANWRW